MGNKDDFSEIVVTINHPHGKIKVGLDEWIRIGPGPRKFLRPSSAYDKNSGKRLPIRVIPLRYRNNFVSRFLIRLGILSDPWSCSGADHGA